MSLTPDELGKKVNTPEDTEEKPSHDSDIMREVIDSKNEQRLRRLLGEGLSPNSTVNSSIGSISSLLYAYQKDAINLMQVLILAGAETKNILKYIETDIPAVQILSREIESGKKLSERERKILLYLSLPKIEELKGFSDYNAESIQDWLAVEGHPWSNKDCSVLQLFGALLETATKQANEANDKTIDFLLTNKLCLNSGSWPLFHAICAKNEKLVLKLILNGFEVNAAVAFNEIGDKHAMWHVHAAYLHGTPNIVKILLEAGADLECLNVDRKTLLEAATEDKRQDILKLFKFDLTYGTEGEGDERLARLYIHQPYKKYTQDDVKKWFAQGGFRAPDCEERPNCLVLTISCDPKNEQTGLKEPTLFYTLAILKGLQLNLTNLSIRALLTAALDVYYERKHVYTLPTYLNAFENIDGYIATLSEDLKADYIQKVQVINEKIKEEKLQYENDLVQRENEKQLSADRALMTKIYPTVTSVASRRQWRAFGSRPEIHEGERMAFIKQANIPEIKVEYENLSDEVKIALKNIATYGAKLQRDLVHLQGAKKDELQTKLEANNEFLRVIYSQENLSEESIRDAYDALEQNDVNRGTGLYRIHSFFKWKLFDDENGKRRFVKSTVGELAYDLMQAVKNQPLSVEEDEEHEDNSSATTVSVGG